MIESAAAMMNQGRINLRTRFVVQSRKAECGVFYSESSDWIAYESNLPSTKPSFTSKNRLPPKSSDTNKKTTVLVWLIFVMVIFI